MKYIAFVICLLGMINLPASAQVKQTFHGPFVAVDNTHVVNATGGSVNMTELLLTNTSPDDINVTVANGGTSLANSGQDPGNGVPGVIVAQIVVWGGSTQVVSFGSGIWMEAGVTLRSTEQGINAQVTWTVVSSGINPNGPN